VFAAGDATRGPSSVIDAIADGRKVADIMDRYLGGNGLTEDDLSADKLEIPSVEISSEQFLHSRQQGRMADSNERITGFGLIQQTLDETTARTEAGRCLQCNLRQNITPVILPPEKWQMFNAETVATIPDAEGVFQLLNAEKKVIRITGTQNIRQSLTECLENPGEGAWFIWEEDPMFTKRESELIQQYLQQYGEMPGGGGDDDLDDLF
ncbi:MAG: BzdV protein, partial [FCB group bacterium]|nr:BzdV protein [FCB group bacterium]